MLFSGTYTYLKSQANGGDVQTAGGLDIVFAADIGGSTILNYEQVIWVATTGQVEYWVRIPSMSSSSDTVIYMLYGKAGDSDHSNKNGVWDSHYLAVYHFGDGTTLDLTDSTSNAHNGTNHSTTAVAGDFGGAVNLVAASSQYVDLGNALDCASKTSMTQAYLNFPTKVRFQRVFSNLTGSAFNGYELYLGNAAGASSDPDVQAGNAGGLQETHTGTDITTGAWHQVCGGWDQSGGGFMSQHLVVDGAVPSQSGTGSLNVPAGNSSVNMNIGRWSGGASNYFGGKIEEARFSDAYRSDAWLLGEWNNWSSPSTFFTVSGTLVAGTLIYQVAMDGLGRRRSLTGL